MGFEAAFEPDEKPLPNVTGTIVPLFAFCYFDMRECDEPVTAETLADFQRSLGKDPERFKPLDCFLECTPEGKKFRVKWRALMPEKE